MNPDVEATINLIKQHGIYGLGGDDGCECTGFEVFGIHVDVSCHDTIRVWSNHFDTQAIDFIQIARLVYSQLIERNDNDTSYEFRFCSFEQDRAYPWGNTFKGKCCYCGKHPRVNPKDYLCANYITVYDAVKMFPLSIVNVKP